MADGAVESDAQLGPANWKNSRGLKLFEAGLGALLFMTLPAFAFRAGNGSSRVWERFGVVCWSNEKFVRQ